jgi:hypothetical protein
MEASRRREECDASGFSSRAGAWTACAFRVSIPEIDAPAAGWLPASSAFLSHQFSTSHQPPVNQQYFSLTIHQSRSPTTRQPNEAYSVGECASEDLRACVSGLSERGVLESS